MRRQQGRRVVCAGSGGAASCAKPGRRQAGDGGRSCEVPPDRVALPGRAANLRPTPPMRRPCADCDLHQSQLNKLDALIDKAEIQGGLGLLRACRMRGVDPGDTYEGQPCTIGTGRGHAWVGEPLGPSRSRRAVVALPEHPQVRPPASRVPVAYASPACAALPTSPACCRRGRPRAGGGMRLGQLCHPRSAAHRLQVRWGDSPRRRASARSEHPHPPADAVPAPASPHPPPHTHTPGATRSASRSAHLPVWPAG